MLQFLYVVLSKQSSGSSTDQGETASIARPFGAGHLWCRQSLQRKMVQKTDVWFYLFHVTLDEEQLQPPIQHK